jgi:chitinase
MSTTLPLCILLSVLLSAGQLRQATISIAIHPRQSTLHVGQTQKFTAVVWGADKPAINWAVREPNGGSITQEGIYTAPKEIGIYHVIAIVTGNGGKQAQAVAKVTVVTHYDTRPAHP